LVLEVIEDVEDVQIVQVVEIVKTLKPCITEEDRRQNETRDQPASP
jgi:hypothetical protein